MQEHEITIQKATKKDLPAIISLVRELAVYEKSEDKMTAGQAIYDDAFDSDHFEAFVAILDAEIVGTTLYYTRFSTWKGPMLHLEDFVIREEHRRKGIGKLLFERFVSEARDRNYAMCMWQVLDWNKSAISFYDKYDVIYEDCWLDVKMYFKN
jgi:GNAT superfamily N-acetyltransferase